MSKLVHLDDNAYESYQKLVNEVPLPPASAPPSFLNGYHNENPDWEPVKKVPHARVSKDAHEDLFSSGEPGVSRDERKSLERSRKQKMQQSSVTLSFGTKNDYSRSSTMPDHTSHTWLENVKQQNRERYENNMQDLSNLRNPDRFDRQKMAAEQIRSSASRNKHQNLIKSSVSFGEDDVSRYETVATEGMKFKEADPNVHQWRAEAKEKKKMLQSTSKGMKLGEPNRGNMYQTDSEYNLQQTIKKKGYTQYNSKSDQKPSHLRDSVGGLLKGEGVDVPHRGRKTLTPKHAIDSVGSILNQDEDYS